MSQRRRSSAQGKRVLCGQEASLQFVIAVAECSVGYTRVAVLVVGAVEARVSCGAVGGYA